MPKYSRILITIFVVIVLKCVFQINGQCNPCPQDQCKNEGNCTVNQTDCTTVCTCSDSFTGKQCEINITDVSTIDKGTNSTTTTTTTALDLTTLRPIEERKCMFGMLTCEHGYCSSSGFKCVCDTNWSGLQCKKLNCPLSCQNDCLLYGNDVMCITTTTFSTTAASQNVSENVTSGVVITTMPTTTVSGPISEFLKNETTTIVTTTTAVPIYGTFPEGHACHANYTADPGPCLIPIPCHNGKCKLFPDGSFKCACDPGADGPMCENKCCKPCKYGNCQLNITGTEYCNCVHTHEGEFCENEIIPEVLEEKTWYWWVVGVCLFLTVILILALVVLPYWMWRNRVILIMKIVHYFQRYEDNDDREWDAFVSYKCDDKDESFVLRQLYSKLEVEMGFKLCLHFRDFIPGDTIANNIIRAVQGSRRTILLLTPRYVQSEFTKFEYQMAQTEMLKRRHRIIPLVLEDISQLKSELDPNLEQIIHSVTYLEWPVEEESAKIDKFWKKLVLSMPKKKDVEERRKAMSSSSQNSYSLSSQISEIPLVSHSISTDSSQSNGVAIVSKDSNGHVPLESIKNDDIILRITDDSLNLNTKESKPSNIDQNLNTYLDIIGSDSLNCSQT